MAAVPRPPARPDRPRRRLASAAPRGRAAGRARRGLGRVPSPVRLESALAAALGDPGVRLVRPDPDGERLDGRRRPAGRRARSRTTSTRSRCSSTTARRSRRSSTTRSCARIPALVGSVMAVLRLAVENERLDARAPGAARGGAGVAGPARRRRRGGAPAGRARPPRRRAAAAGRRDDRAPAGAPDGGATDAAPELRDELAATADELQGAIDDLRELARGIHPAILEDDGLPAAVAALGRRAGVAVEVGSELARRLPAARRGDAYFTVAEALTNAARHARATPGGRRDPRRRRPARGRGRGRRASAARTPRAAPGCAAWPTGWPRSTGSSTVVSRRPAAARRSGPMVPLPMIDAPSSPTTRRSSARASSASSRMPGSRSSARRDRRRAARGRRGGAPGPRGRRHPDAAGRQRRADRGARHPGALRRRGPGPRPVAVPRARVRAAPPGLGRRRRRATCSRTAWARRASSPMRRVASPPAGRRSTRASSTSSSARGASNDRLGRLTPREQEILALVAEGRSNRSIADAPEPVRQDRRGRDRRHLLEARPRGGRARQPARPRRARLPRRQAGGRFGRPAASDARQLLKADAVGVELGTADAGLDERQQALRDVHAPGVAAELEALVGGRQPDVGEADLGPAVDRRDVEWDLGARPLGLVVDEVSSSCCDPPHDALAGKSWSTRICAKCTPGTQWMNSSLTSWVRPARPSSTSRGRR